MGVIKKIFSQLFCWHDWKFDRVDIVEIKSESGKVEGYLRVYMYVCPKCKKEKTGDLPSEAQRANGTRP